MYILQAMRRRMCVCVVVASVYVVCVLCVCVSRGRREVCHVSHTCLARAAVKLAVTVPVLHRPRLSSCAFAFR